MKAALTVIPVGSKAMLQEAVEVIITAVNIRAGNRLEYEASWVSGGTHNCKWVTECELTSAADKMKIGFKE